METRSGHDAGDETAAIPAAIPAAITVRYWASARAAAGVETDDLPVTGALTLIDVVRRAASLHPDTRLPGVLEVCSVLVGDQPVKSRDPGAVLVQPGQTVEFLPPFAGG
jgi:molybdopterin converting factor small subunit